MASVEEISSVYPALIHHSHFSGPMHHALPTLKWVVFVMTSLVLAFIILLVAFIPSFYQVSASATSSTSSFSSISSCSCLSLLLSKQDRSIKKN
jgi:hypothetical protein